MSTVVKVPARIIKRNRTPWRQTTIEGEEIMAKYGLMDEEPSTIDNISNGDEDGTE